MEEYGIFKSYLIYFVFVKLYFRLSYKVNYKIMFDEMIEDGLIFIVCYYVFFVEVFIERGDFMGVFLCLEEMQWFGVVCERSIDVYIVFV